MEEINEILMAWRTKKRKGVIDLNRTPGEKRQNKYYWPKIDVQKVPTPKPKTPKAQTPKVRRKSYGKKVGNGPQIPEHVQHEPEKDLVCREVLNIEGSEKASAEIPEHVELELEKDSTCRKLLNFEDSEKADLEDGEVKALQQIADVPDDRIVESSDKIKLGDDKNVESSDKIKVGKRFRVYRRTSNRCLNQCRRIGPNFPKGFKEKRARRIRKLIEDLKPFEEFDYSFINKDLSDRLAIMKGKTMMLFPTKLKFSHEPFRCILRVLSSPTKLRKRKRSTKRLAKRFTSTNNNVANESVISQSTIHPYSTFVLESPGDGNNGVYGLHPIQMSFPNYERLASCYPTLNSSVKGSKAAKESKVKDEKEKKSRRPYKRKEKRRDYVAGIFDWRDTSLEQVLDPLIQDFNSLDLYDDPSKLERWSIMVSDQSNNGDAPESNGEERTILYARIARFLSEMTNFQGRKDFVKWNGSVLDSVVGVYLTQNVSDVLSSNAYMLLASRFPLKPSNQDKENPGDSETICCQGSWKRHASTATPIVEHPFDENEETTATRKEYDAALRDMLSSLPSLQLNKGKEKKGEETEKFDWETIRLQFLGQNTERKHDTLDSVDWEAVRNAPVNLIADAIESRGQHRIIAAKIQKALNRLVHDHGTLDLEWLRNAPPEVTKAYLLSFYGLGLKSVECLQLLTLHHHGFPVDVNIARIAIRLGWVPLKPLPVGLPFHLLQKYPLENDIQQYLWPRLQHLKQEHLYRLHYQMITFGKVFCLKKNPNCRACPFKSECKYYKSVVDSMQIKHPRLPWTQDKRMLKLKRNKKKNEIPNPFDVKKESSRLLVLPAPVSAPIGDSALDAIFSVSDCTSNSHFWSINQTSQICEDVPIIEYPKSPMVESPKSPKKAEETDIPDIEDLLKYDSNGEFIVLDLKSEHKEFLSNPYEINYAPPQNLESSRALVKLSSEDANIPLLKHINPERLRTEHQVYELPFDHPLLSDLDRQEGNIPYLLAIWTQGNEKSSDTLEGCVLSSESVPQDSSTVPGTLLIPVRTAMRGSFPLNGTYFQVNEVFVDDETCEHPINVPTDWIWWLPKRTLYCGSGTSSIFRGLTEEEIRHCCWEGYICTRGFNRQTRAPKPLSYKFHNRPYVKGKVQQDEEDD